VFRWRRVGAFVALLIAIGFVLGMAAVWTSGGKPRPTVTTVPPECASGSIGDHVVRSEDGGLFFDC
jgi:hypothetical protein